jgi:hypothetical protein
MFDLLAATGKICVTGPTSCGDGAEVGVGDEPADDVQFMVSRVVGHPHPSAHAPSPSPRDSRGCPGSLAWYSVFLDVGGEPPANWD